MQGARLGFGALRVLGVELKLATFLLLQSMTLTSETALKT